MLTISRLFYGLLSVFIFLGILGTNLQKDESLLSPENLTSYKDYLLVSDKTGEEIIFLDTKSDRIAKRIQLSGPPGKTAVYEAGGIILVPISESQGKLVIVDLKKGETIAEIEVGHTPVSVLISGNKAFVVNKFSSDISIIDLKEMKETSRIPVLREPVGAVISGDGSYLFVANALPNMRSTDEHISASVSVINLNTLKKEKDLLLPNGSNAVKDICISADGKFAYLTHILGHYQLIPTQIERGWINTNAFSIIDIEKQSLFTTVLLDDIDLGAANPWGIICSEDDTKLLVALAGTNELCIIDRNAMHQKFSEGSQSLDEIKNDFSFLYGMKKRIPSGGIGSRGIAVTDGRIFISNYFSGSITSVKLNDNTADPLTIIPGSKIGPREEKLGEIYFHDATLCFQNWQSCSSCHPDARTDALNWDLLNDGMGNPKNTKSLVFSHQTPPTMITGIRPDAETCVRAGIKYILFAQGTEERAKAIDSYLKSLKPVASPELKYGKLSKKAMQGEKIFQKAGCGQCHTGEYFTDLNKYDIGTGIGREKEKQFDTPTLREAWRNAPYLNDGRALSIKEVITLYNQDDRHGITSNLTDEEIDALSAYLLSI